MLIYQLPVCSLAVDTSRVVIMSVHQPRYAIFKLMDTLTLLSEGELVYHGPAQHCIEYFSELGIQYIHIHVYDEY